MTAPVLVVHARDDHHVPFDYALAAARGRPGWEVRLLDHGGHHAHRHCPDAWLDAITPWLARDRPVISAAESARRRAP